MPGLTRLPVRVRAWAPPRHAGLDPASSPGAGVGPTTSCRTRSGIQSGRGRGPRIKFRVTWSGVFRVKRGGVFRVTRGGRLIAGIRPVELSRYLLWVFEFPPCLCHRLLALQDQPLQLLPELLTVLRNPLKHPFHNSHSGCPLFGGISGAPSAILDCARSVQESGPPRMAARSHC